MLTAQAAPSPASRDTNLRKNSTDAFAVESRQDNFSPRENETELVAMLLEKDDRAYASLYERYKAQMFRTAMRITRNEEDASDAVQDALLNAFRHMDSFRADASIGTWLTRIVMNCAYMQLRKKRRQPTCSLEDDSDETLSILDTLVDTTTDTEGTVLRSERVGILNVTLEELRPDFRELLEMYRQEDLTLAEIARRYGIPVSSAKTRLLRARNALKGMSKKTLAAKAGSKPIGAFTNLKKHPSAELGSRRSHREISAITAS